MDNPASADNPIPTDESAQADLVAQLLDEIIESVHPLLAEAFFCAALPHWYDLPLFTAIRAKDDERNEGLIPRLEKYSFILPQPGAGETAFRTRDSERDLLNRRWIKQDAAAYVAAHQRAHIYWQNHQSPPETTKKIGTPDEITHEQNELYHHYFVSLTNARQELIELFRSYNSERLVAAIERLLHTADEARDYLHLLQQNRPNSGNPDNNDSGNNDAGSPHIGSFSAPASVELANFDHLLEHLYARQAQLQGNWLESMAMFEVLRNKPGLTPELVPFVARGYARSLKATGLYVESIEEYKQAIRLFKKLLKEQAPRSTGTQSGYVTSHTGLQTELGLTMIDLGEAYTDFALSANVDPHKALRPYGWWERVQQVYEFLTSLPLVVYLSIYIGRRVWHPTFWRVLDNLDWIIGRLFGKGADQYLRADKILTQFGSEADAILANERLAYLYLKMGDFRQARTLFADLLEQTPSPLSDYHRALVRRGLAEAELGLGEPRAARLFLQKSLPVLRAYGDRVETAEAQTLLAETMLAAAEPTQALEQFEEVLAYHQDTENREKATGIYERLGILQRSGTLDPTEALKAQTVADNVTKRRYPVRFRSLTTIFTQRVLLLLLSLFFVLMPLQIIQMESSTQLAPEINFRVPPLLLTGDVEFKPELSVGVTALIVTGVEQAESWLIFGGLVFLFYLLFVTLMGVLAIVSTPLHRMQHAMQAKAIDVDEDGIRIGGENVSHIVPWQNVRKLLRSDMSMFTSRLRIDDSLIVLANSAFGARRLRATGGARDKVEAASLVTIRGSTAWYSSLADWLTARVPSDSDQRVLSYSWLRNWAGLLYGFGLISVTLLAFCMWLFPSSPLTTDLPLLRYSLFDLYPYLYLLLFIPPMLWFVFRPLRIRSYLAPRSLIPWAVGAVGLLIFVVLILAKFRPWLTVPDIYPASVILFMLAGSATTIWQARDPISHVPSFSLWSRGAAAFVALLMILVTGTYVSREIVAYHYLVNGNYFRDKEQQYMQSLERPISSEEQKESVRLLNQALSYYDSAHKMADYPLPGLQSANTRGVGQLGPPQYNKVSPNYDQITWYASAKNIADIASKLGDQNELAEVKPEEFYKKLLRYVPEEGKAAIHVGRALALTNRGRQSVEEHGGYEANVQLYREAIQEFSLAIEKAKPKDAARYRLWRGAAYNALYSPENATTRVFQEKMVADYEGALADAELGLLDDKSAAKALLGLGWISYQIEDAQPLRELKIGSFERFQLASIKDPESTEAYLGMGYFHFREADREVDRFNQLSTKDRATNTGKQMVQRARRKLDDAELLWLHAQKLNPFEPSIPISLATLYWKSSIPAFGERLSARCENYQESVRLLAGTLNSQSVQIQQEADVAFTYRTIAQIQYARQYIGCPDADPLVYHQYAIESYDQAISRYPENANFLHMQARIKNSLARLYLADAEERLQNQLDVHKRVFRLQMDALAEIDQALTIEPDDNADVDYYPNQHVDSIIKRALSNGRSLLGRGESSDAVKIYQQAITVAIKHGGEREDLQNASDQLAEYLDRNSSQEGEAIQVALARAIDVLALNDPALAFSEGLAAMSNDNVTNFSTVSTLSPAINSYQRALRLAVNRSDIRSVAVALAEIYESEKAPSDEVIALFDQALPQLTQKQDKTANTDALNLAFIAAAVGKTPTAMYWYAEGIHRSTTQGPSVGMNNWAQAKRLSYTWENNGVQLHKMLNELSKMVSDQEFLYENTDLQENNRYWFNLAESIYFLGWQAFLQGDEEAAQRALVVGRPYADRAAELGLVGSYGLNTYYPEGALSWYHFVRAQEKQTAEDYRGALQDYSLAVFASRATTNKTAIEERAQASFRAGLMALQFDNEPLSFTWYKRGMSYVQDDADKANMEKQRNTAISELKQAMDANPTLRPNGEPILQTLSQAAPEG